MPKALLGFGVDFLDDALGGIMPDDLVLIGAPSGSGKTQLCCNIALANIERSKRVHYIALEAGRYEIERRLKFNEVFQRYISDPKRPKLPKLTFASWLKGGEIKELEPYEIAAAEYCDNAYRNLFLLYKERKFGVDELVKAVLSCADDTDLILVDHVHYFDFDDDNENRAIKNIAKTVRTLALDQQKPIILVAHLRKRDKANEELVAGLDEFHGSSDLYKIATKVVTMSPGKSASDGTFETFFRTPKNRLDGSATRYMAREFFNPKTGAYEKERYQLGWCDQKRSAGFAEIDHSQHPEWSRLRRSVLPKDAGGKGVSQPNANRTPTFQRMHFGSERD